MMNTKIISALFLVSLLLFSSCEDVLKDKTDAEIALALEGEWAVDETSSIFDKSAPLYKATMQTYSAFISVSENDSTLINIDNIYGLSIDGSVFAQARVSGYTLTFNRNQSLPDGYMLIEGVGSINKNLQEIVLNYSVDDGSGELDEVSATYTYKY